MQKNPRYLPFDRLLEEVQTARTAPVGRKWGHAKWISMQAAATFLTRVPTRASGAGDMAAKYTRLPATDRRSIGQPYCQIDRAYSEIEHRVTPLNPLECPSITGTRPHHYPVVVQPSCHKRLPASTDSCSSDIGSIYEREKTCSPADPRRLWLLRKNQIQRDCRRPQTRVRQTLGQQSQKPD